MEKPPWFNDETCGAVSNGTQVGLTCGLFAVNHCLAAQEPTRHSITLDDFQSRAGDGHYEEGDFDNLGLMRNLNYLGFPGFDVLRDEDHEDVAFLARSGRNAFFAHAHGYIVHGKNAGRTFLSRRSRGATNGIGQATRHLCAQTVSDTLGGTP